MSYLVATWGDGHLVMVNDETLEVVDSSSTQAKLDAETFLAMDELSVWAEGDQRVRYARGQDGFARAALGRLPHVLVTGGGA